MICAGQDGSENSIAKTNTNQSIAKTVFIRIKTQIFRPEVQTGNANVLRARKRFDDKIPKWKEDKKAKQGKEGIINKIENSAADKMTNMKSVFLHFSHLLLHNPEIGIRFFSNEIAKEHKRKSD